MSDSDLPQLDDLPEVPDDEDDEPDEEAAEARGTTVGRLDRLRRAVPLPVLTGVGSGVLVAAVAVLLMTLLLGGAGPEAASASPGESVAVADAHTEADGHAVSTPTAVPTRTPGPTATPTPVRWERQDDSWIVFGRPSPDRGQLFLPDRYLFFGEGNLQETFTLTVRFTVLTASGERAPWWGVMLSYLDDRNFIFMESAADNRRPTIQMLWGSEGNGAPLGEPVPAPGLEFWGRDTHELTFRVGDSEITGWLNDLPIGQWARPPVPTNGKKGVTVWFGSKMRFDTLAVE